MANRSTFNSVCPREVKRVLAFLGKSNDNHFVGETKRMMIEAHRCHRNFKNKRHNSPSPSDDGDDNAA